MADEPPNNFIGAYLIENNPCSIFDFCDESLTRLLNPIVSTNNSFPTSSKTYPCRKIAAYYFSGSNAIFSPNNNIYPFEINGINYSSVFEYVLFSMFSELTGKSARKDITLGLRKQLIMSGVSDQQREEWILTRGILHFQRAYLEKAKQKSEFCSALLATGEYVLFYTYRKDRFFGTSANIYSVKQWLKQMVDSNVSISYPMEYPVRIRDLHVLPKTVNGYNILGAILMSLRNQLQQPNTPIESLQIYIPDINSTITPVRIAPKRAFSDTENCQVPTKYTVYSVTYTPCNMSVGCSTPMPRGDIIPTNVFEDESIREFTTYSSMPTPIPNDEVQILTVSTPVSSSIHKIRNEDRKAQSFTPNSISSNRIREEQAFSRMSEASTSTHKTTSASDVISPPHINSNQLNFRPKISYRSSSPSVQSISSSQIKNHQSDTPRATSSVCQKIQNMGIQSPYSIASSSLNKRLNGMVLNNPISGSLTSRPSTCFSTCDDDEDDEYVKNMRSILQKPYQPGSYRNSNKDV